MGLTTPPLALALCVCRACRKVFWLGVPKDADADAIVRELPCGFGTQAAIQMVRGPQSSKGEE